MKVHDDHLFHGAALIQIAEDQRFTAINALTLSGRKSRSAYRINDDIGVYLKYASKPTAAHQEYQFTFASHNLGELSSISNNVTRTFLGLVCVEDRQICCLPYATLLELVARRKAAKGSAEDAYAVLAKLPVGKRFRVYVNEPRRRNKVLGSPVLISRAAFPGQLFE